MINEDHSINAVLVQSAQKETYKGDNVTATDFPNDYIQTISGGTVIKGASDKTQWSIASYLARVQYSYKGKYMASGAIRADGSSRFGKITAGDISRPHHWHGELAGRISSRRRNFLSFVDDLKIRTSYGVTGNFQIGNYDHLSLMALDNYILGTGNGQLVQGYKPNTIKNDDLSWEKNAMVNVGVDLQMFKGLLGITVDYYNTNTSNMLLNVPVPHLTGYSTALMNNWKSK